MGKSIFEKQKPDDRPPTPIELIEPEIVHLRKGYSIRYGQKGGPKRPLWLVFLAFCTLVWLYLMDPIYHAWYKGEAGTAYLYLHNYGGGARATELAACGILSPDEIQMLDRRDGSFQDLYPSPAMAAKKAQTIVAYMKSVHDLHAGNYIDLDPLQRMRYLLFIRTGLFLPTQWNFLDPQV
jgi:hypothetical protein